ncbi:hypothetical protein BU23DRAFT_61960 [Bimuria novae-zelandiae CBS 107.79]|uniref:Gfd2/YDR514C-like C-terminal domain-containing protein n=1 Tax=Bimuria novae-zelandiae CBS 107.79 TaxID=1447943 RepID=A0A6A5UHN3_9PLEO|nr:hypothetical protein BU23DRAFT_61960 [Bimuria novae-zelandiae CBS 107.79]
MASANNGVSITADLVAFQELARFLKHYNYLEVVQHFYIPDCRIGDAPALLDQASFVVLDLEWWENVELNNITEVGITVLRGKDMQEHAKIFDLENMLMKSTTHHWRVIEHCHMRNKLPKLNPGAELNSLFAHTRYVAKSDLKRGLIKIFHGHSDDGHKAPVILAGYAVWHDTGKLSRQYGVNLDKIPNIVYQTKDMNILAMQASVHAQGEKKPLSKIIEGFGV